VDDGFLLGDAYTRRVQRIAASLAAPIISRVWETGNRTNRQRRRSYPAGRVNRWTLLVIFDAFCFIHVTHTAYITIIARALFLPRAAAAAAATAAPLSVAERCETCSQR